MNKWKQEFARKMEDLGEQSSADFDRFADEVLVPIFRDVSEFVAQWRFQTSIPQSNMGKKSFKFALTENRYLLILFRIEGINTLGCEYECCLPGKECIAGPRNSMILYNANQLWAESCFQTALDDFIEKFSSDKVRQEMSALAEV